MRFRGDVTLTYTADVFCFTHFLSGFLDASSHLYKRVRPSVGPSVTQVQKPRFSAVIGRGEIL